MQLSSAREAEKRWRYNEVDISVVGYSPDGNDFSTKAEESSLSKLLPGNGCRGD
jgi:hypothetical protein